MDISVDKLRLVVLRNLHNYIPGRVSHHRNVKDEQYMVELKERYPFFSDTYNIFYTPPGYIVPIHIDFDRHCTLNVPIDYTKDSHTIVYDMGDNASLKRVDERVYDIVESEATEVFRYTLTEPVIMNVKLPHSVIGGPLRARLILSWSVNSDTSYEELRKLYG
jgi:hypothetical protein